MKTPFNGNSGPGRDFAAELLGVLFLVKWVIGILYLSTARGSISQLALLSPQLSFIGLIFIMAFGLGKILYVRVVARAELTSKIFHYWPLILSLSFVVWWENSVVILSSSREFLSVISLSQLPLMGGIIFGYYNPIVTKWWYGSVMRPLRILILSLVAMGSGLGFVIFPNLNLVIGTFGLPLVILGLAAGWIVTGYHGLKYFEGILINH